MKFHRNDQSAGNRITAYGQGFITVNEERLTHSAIILSGTLIRDWPPQAFADLRPEHIDSLIDHGPEIILLGTGKRQHLLAPALMSQALSRGIGLEVMDTAAACRTYNVLVAEDRSVLAALMVIKDSRQN